LPAGHAAWRWPRGYVENVAAAIACAVEDERAAGRIYNVADECPPQEEWVRQIASAAGWSGEVVVVPAERLPDQLRPRVDLSQDYALDASRIGHELRFAPAVGRGEGLRRTVEWERANPPASMEPLDYETEDGILARLAC